ncbi:MAG: aminotransferase class V-fold PLP-dependent enzyme [Miltoncostaeaceae bacterium]
MIDVESSPTSVRAQFPSFEREVYLNAGGAGPLPLVVAEAIEKALRRDLARGRMSVSAAEAEEALAERLRRRLEGVIGARPGSVAIASNTTAAQNIAIWGLDWRAGDEVLTTDVEHPGLGAPLEVLRRRRGVVVHVVPGAEAAAGLAEAVEARLSDRTRMVAVSHVSYATGALLDVRGAALAARGAGALTLVDGAQAVGALPVDVGDLDVDAYAFPAHKWLCGPEGLGALWLGPRALDAVALTFASYESGSDHRPDGSFAPHRGARRYETSTPAFALVPGWLAALDWLESLGWSDVHARTAALHRAARRLLREVSGVTILTPPAPQAGLITFTPGTLDAEQAARDLEEGGVMVRAVPAPRALRASVGFYNDMDDLRRLARAVERLVG